MKDLGSQYRSAPERLRAWMTAAPLVTMFDGRRESVSSVPRMLREFGLVRVTLEAAAECLEALKLAGYALQSQYEAVRNEQVDATVLRTLASAKLAIDNFSSAFRAKSTTWHQDAYQYFHTYLGRVIAGIGFMPTCEVLGFEVDEPRTVMFADVNAAGRAFMTDYPELFDLLMEPVFSVDGRYREEDPALGDAGLFPVLYLDGGRPRWHVGGSLQASGAPGYALEVFRSYLPENAFRLKLDADELVITDQERVAHLGIRVPGVNGNTVLWRWLLRLEDEDDLR